MTDETPDPMTDGNATQVLADKQVLQQEIGAARMELARLKVAYYSIVGDAEITFVVKGASGSQAQKAAAVRKMIDKRVEDIRVLQTMYDTLSSGNPIPVPESPLTVVKAGVAH